MAKAESYPKTRSIARQDPVTALPVLPQGGSAVTAVQLAAIEAKIATVITQIENIDHLEEWRAQAKALEAYLRSRELQRPMLGAQRRIEARIGQLLGEPTPGMRTDLEPPTREYEVVGRDGDRLDYRLLARALSGDCNLTDEEWQKSRRALVSLVRFRLGLMPETPDLPEGQYSCIVADPPWQLDTGPDVMGGTGEQGHDQLSYAQMSLDAIAALDVGAIAAPNAHLYLWTTNRYIEAAYDIARAWGFKPSELLTWCKQPRGIGLGDTFRHTTEFILFARRGSLTSRQIIDRTHFDWPRGKHSVKPQAFYELVESVTPPPYLDMFARRARPQWTVWGAEAPTDVNVTT
jgi:N6-adenosine-specific RNA methylase IME4